MTATRTSIGRGVTVAVTVVFLGVLGYYLVQAGFTWTRLAFFVVLGGLAVTGGAGIVYQRGLLAGAGTAGLVLLGFWQAVLWIYILPVVVVFSVAALTTPNGPDHSFS